jgi:hypothetical protein
MLGSVAVERVFEHHGGGGVFDDLTARFDESHGLHDPVCPTPTAPPWSPTPARTPTGSLSAAH